MKTFSFYVRYLLKLWAKSFQRLLFTQAYKLKIIFKKNKKVKQNCNEQNTNHFCIIPRIFIAYALLPDHTRTYRFADMSAVVVLMRRHDDTTTNRPILIRINLCSTAFDGKPVDISFRACVLLVTPLLTRVYSCAPRCCSAAPETFVAFDSVLVRDLFAPTHRRR
jgi:hypothetical protein